MKSMLIVYTGAKAVYNFHHGAQYVFERDVPRRFPAGLIKRLPSGFSVCDETTECKTGKTIYIKTEINDILLSIISAQLVAHMEHIFPFNQISVISHSAYKGLFKHHKAKASPNTFLYKVTHRDNSLPHFSNVHLRRHPLINGYVNNLGLQYDVLNNDLMSINHIETTDTEDCVIYHQSGFDDNDKSITDSIQSKQPGTKIIHAASTYTDSAVFGALLSTIANAKKVIIVGNVDAAYLALALGKDVVAYPAAVEQTSVLNFQCTLFDKIKKGQYTYFRRSEKASDVIASTLLGEKEAANE